MQNLVLKLHRLNYHQQIRLPKRTMIHDSNISKHALNNASTLFCLIISHICETSFLCSNIFHTLIIYIHIIEL